MTVRKKPTKRPGRGKTPSEAKLDEMVEETIVDAYGESEQTVGFYTMLEDNLAMPFKTEMLGVEVTVERIDLSDDEQIVAVCSRGKAKQCTDPRKQQGPGDRALLCTRWHLAKTKR